MNSIYQIFSTREIATIFWIFLLFVYIFLKADLRQSFFAILKVLFKPKLLFVIFWMIMYVFLLVLSFRKIGFWDLSELKETVLWTGGVAFIMLMNTDKAVEDDFIKKTIFDVFKLAVLIEFLINLHTFNLVVEIIQFPIILVLGLMNVMAEQKDEYRSAKKFTDFILSIYLLGLLSYSIYYVVVDFNNAAKLKTLNNLLLSPILTVTYLPFVYLMALLFSYESLFVRVTLFNRDTDSKLVSYAKRKIFSTFLFNLRGLNSFSKNLGFYKLRNRDDVSELIHNFKDKKSL